VNDWVGDAYTCPAAQMAWLEADLAEGYETIIITFHYPPFSILDNNPGRLDQAESIRNTFHELFNESGVDLVFSGHNHYYHHTSLDGIHYVTAAGGGAPLYDIQTVGTDWKEDDIGFGEYHYCVCQIDEVNHRLTVNTVLMNGAVADSFYIDLPSEGEFPWVIVMGIIGGSVAVIVVLVLVKRLRK
jgi:3',5'-cyclic AMP phosphodiesterase CpdA